MDADLLGEAMAATGRGEAGNLSAWVNEAMRLKIEHDRGLSALGRVIADFEATAGTLTQDDLDGAVRAAQIRAVRVRGVRAGDAPTLRVAI